MPSPRPRRWSASASSGSDNRGKGLAFAAGLDWAIDRGASVVNLSLSSRSEAMYATLHDLADRAYFANCLLVCAANNVAVASYPSLFAAVVSVAAHDVRDAETSGSTTRIRRSSSARTGWTSRWPGGTAARIVATGNSFAAPHIAGLAARIRAAHPGATPFEVKTILAATATQPRLTAVRDMQNAPSEGTGRSVGGGVSAPGKIRSVGPLALGVVGQLAAAGRPAEVAARAGQPGAELLGAGDPGLVVLDVPLDVVGQLAAAGRPPEIAAGAGQPRSELVRARGVALDVVGAGQSVGLVDAAARRIASSRGSLLNLSIADPSVH